MWISRTSAISSLVLSTCRAEKRFHTASAILTRSSLRRVLVKSNANGWSARMQTSGQWQCKWVVKSMQLHNWRTASYGRPGYVETGHRSADPLRSSQMKVYLVICAYRDRKNSNIATINYATISRQTGVPLHQIPSSLNRLYHLELISYKQADYYDFWSNEQDRTNRYLVRGLGDRWPAFNPEGSAGATGKSAKASKAQISAANKFLSE